MQVVLRRRYERDNRILVRNIAREVADDRRNLEQCSALDFPVICRS